jgi:hypothetical protein
MSFRLFDIENTGSEAGKLQMLKHDEQKGLKGFKKKDALYARLKRSFEIFPGTARDLLSKSGRCASAAI